jgi:uncharacterized membrane-anchored protein
MTGLLASAAERFARIPKPVLYGAVAVIQIALLGAMVVDRAQILRGGTEVKLQTRPIDPRDLLRGDYVVLGYDISTVASGALFKQPSASRHPVVYVKLAPKADGLYEAVSAHTAVVPVTSPEVLIRGTVAYGASCEPDGQSFCKELQIRYNLEKYFVPEGEGKKLEDARNQRKLTIVAAVLPSGRAAIKRLLLDGQPVYEEPWY